MKSKRIFKERNLLLIVYSLIFLFLIFQKAIYSPDTYSYLNAMPYRHLGYVIFVKLFSLVFGEYFNFAVVVFQSLFCLTGIHFFFKKVSVLLQLTIVLKCLTLIILFFPLFEPLSVANNVCPEGISYPLYLLFVTLNLEFLFNDNSKILKYIFVCFLALVFTRGQFMFSSLIFAFVYVVKHKNHILKSGHPSKLLFLMAMPIVVVLGEMSYHKLKDGIFMTTPFGFVNTSTSAFYVSNSNDKNLILNTDDRALFESCYNSLAEQNLLLSQNKAKNYKNQYLHYQKKLTAICNRTIHESGKDYYLKKNSSISEKTKYLHAKAFYDTEKTCKNLTFILITQNFNKWIQLYAANVLHGFHYWLIFIVVVFSFLFSSFKLLFAYKKTHSLLFIFSSLSILNAMISALFTYSIPRLLFYNYALIFLCFVILIVLAKEELKRRTIKL